METRASPFLVGLFTIGVLTVALLFVFWLGRYSETTGRQTYRIVFSDEVTGLSRGSSVLFNGIKIGEVDSLTISPRDASQVVATITVDPTVPVTVDTKAQLQFQGITGVATVQMRPGRSGARPLTEAWGDDPEPPIIYAERSTFQDLLEGAQSLLGKLDDVAGRIDTVLSANEASVNSTIRNVETFTSALAENSDSVSSFLSDAGSAARRFDELGREIEAIAIDLRPLIEAIEPDEIRSMVSNLDGAAQNLNSVVGRVDELVEENARSVTAVMGNAERFSATLADNSDTIERFITDASAAAQSLSQVGARIETLATDLQPIIEAVEPDEVRRIVRDVGSFTDMLARNTDQFDTLVSNAGEAGERLASLATRLEGVSDDVSQVLQAVDPAAVSRTVANIEGFSSRLFERTDDVDSFITDASAVASQLRESSQRLDQLLVRVDGMVGEGGDGFMTDIADAARSFRSLADNLNSRLDVITADIERYGGGGLREFQSFMTEGRRTLSNIERVIGNLERDPRRFLFGGSQVPEYTPGRRF